ncbi:MAG: 1-acyl-sn-glycerol-3-phosphate acyltransferase [Gammaproteobacteria bacterium]|nr:1-acyl-sn-glycerol-3-phosphate acyltransferase [Gammaproteobacteria bacterium]MDH5799894.1 1-acyl-sn-glycerol-3-phosphate acyltransferase [Gammaproteobacteria bacterium]
MVNVFYRELEISGLENLPQSGAVILCANHANALADALIVQTITTKTVHPIARSGLFKNPVLKPVLNLIQAVPVYRQQDGEGDMNHNLDMFARCHDMLEIGEWLLIFPEGQSHSDPKLRTLKTGIARLAEGALQRNIEPLIVPIGLNFSDKGRFRSRVLIKINPPLAAQQELDRIGPDPERIRLFTHKIQTELEAVTLNADSEGDFEFIQWLERFFAMRHGKYRRRSMELRFKALKKIAQAQEHLREHCPNKVVQLKRQLAQFERLCQHWGIRDYTLTFDYRLGNVSRFILRSIAVIVLVLPLAAWGILNSIAPFILTRAIARAVSKGRDQYDTAKMVLGLFFFWIFWGTQTALVFYYYEIGAALLYAASLPISAALALFYRKERRRIWENLRVFALFVRKRKLRRYLEAKRKHIEAELAQLVRIAKKTTL